MQEIFASSLYFAGQTGLIDQQKNIAQFLNLLINKALKWAVWEKGVECLITPQTGERLESCY